ncbi:MAG: radical SAM protein, partial [Candidatus Acidiferrum sp.]
MSELIISDARLKPIAKKVLADERLPMDDGIALYRSPDLLAVGWLANYVREKRHGNITYFNVNRHINPTNVCVAHCRLCAFGRDPNAPGAYTFALEEIYQRAEQGVREGATEFHIVGGLHPDLAFDHYLELVRGLK